MLSLLVLAVFGASLSPMGVDDDGFGSGDLITGNTGTEIVIDGTQPGSGTPGTSPIGDWDDDWDEGDGDATPLPPPKDLTFDECLTNWDSYIRCFEGSEDPDPAAPTEEVTAEIPAITIADVARFAPDGSVLAGEPGNVGVAGLPTNFVATASAHTVNGALFGFPIAVRFTPSGYDFSFGDGSSVTTSSGGQSWVVLGQAQFTPTSTSHTYPERGSYFAQVNVRYTAEVDFGIGWFPISGEVTAVGPPEEIRIFEAHTALVANTCQQAPGSPGC